MSKEGYAPVAAHEDGEPELPRISGGEAGASWFSRMVFQWVDPAVWEGAKLDHIDSEQLWELADCDQMETIEKEMKAAWDEQVAQTDTQDLIVDAAVAASGQGASMWNMPLAKALWRVHRGKYVYCCIIKFANDFNQILPPIILNLILQFLTDPTSLTEGDGDDSWYAYFLVLVMFATMCVKTIVENQYFFHMMRMGMQVRVAVMGLVYRKSLRLTQAAKSHHTEGEIVNMMQQDSERLMNFVPSSPQLVSGVIQMILNVSLLVYYVGVAVLPGILILIILVPLNRMLMRMQMKLRFAGQKKSDERIKLINEVMKGIRVVKTYAWEDFLFGRINELRGAEIEMIRTRAYVRAVASVCLWTAPAFAVVATFSTFVVVGNEMNAESLPTVFTAMMLFNNLRFPLMMYPMMLTQYGDSKVSLGRLQQFFARDEIKADRRGVTNDRSIAISIRDGHFHWRASPQKKQNLGGSTGGPGGGRGGGRSGGRGGGRGGRGGGRGGGGGGAGGGGDSVPSVIEMFKEQGTEQLCACFRRDAVWGPTKVKVFTALTLAPTLCLLIYQSISDHALPGERNLALLAAIFCLLVSIASYLVKREKMNEQAQQKAQEKQDVIASVQEEFKTDFALKDINLEVEAGQLVMVVGAVGSGKSSVIMGILGELEPVKGVVELMPNATVSYVAQGAWLMNATLRDNITFVSEYQEHKYDTIVEAAGLLQDLAELPNSDQTEIGERGINLSGGQKQRISIARAMYNDADIYIFDDPLSALDAHVGQHVFQNVISQLVQENKTVVLVTNQLQFVNHADKIVFLKHDKVAQEAWVHKQGSYAELMQDQEFAELMKDVGAGNDEVVARSPKANDNASAGDKDKDTKADGAGPPGQSPNDGKRKSSGTLTTAEEREQGEVSWDVYRGYLKLAKATSFFIGVVIICWAAQFTSAVNDLWVTWWTQQKFELSNAAYNLIYLLGAVAFSLLTFTNGILWAQVGMLTAENIHAELMQSVLAGRMEFFDTTPVGRMISRFAKDMQAVDDNIPMQFDMCVRVVIILILNFCVIGYITPPFMVVVAPIMVIYFYVQRVYKLAALQFKRLDSTTRSPIYNQFSESLGGLTTIRAYGVEPICADKNSAIVNTNTRSQFTQRMVERWLSVRLESIGNVVVAVAGLLGVFSAGSGTYAGFIGISLVYGMRVTGMLNWAVRSTTELATQMNCVERILHYVKTVEPEEKESFAEPPSGWPHAGVVEFRKYSMRYRAGLDLVLKEVDCIIQAGEKVGICGRTGSGKSSLMLALFRMVEAASGSIVIDGVDISTISLKELRSRVSIIPQDPVLFSGTVSFNIDPTQASTDSEIWAALDKVHLGEKVRSLEGGLEATVSEYGDMFSTGQRQLVCMARALLRKTKVLLMDEATSSVDIDTDRQIQDQKTLSTAQELVRSRFADRTILTIAHRLNTIIDNDKILLMDFGRVAEYDSPRALLNDYNSGFSALVRKLGEENEGKLREAAGAKPSNYEHVF